LGSFSSEIMAFIAVFPSLRHLSLIEPLGNWESSLRTYTVLPIKSLRIHSRGGHNLCSCPCLRESVQIQKLDISVEVSCMPYTEIW
jgi:hypothetical protein